MGAASTGKGRTGPEWAVVDRQSANGRAVGGAGALVEAGLCRVHFTDETQRRLGGVITEQSRTI
jgi:hypothetical protein